MRTVITVLRNYPEEKRIDKREIKERNERNERKRGSQQGDRIKDQEAVILMSLKQ